MVDAICRAFHCLPSQALRELRDGPFGLVWRVLDWRAYADAYHRVKSSRDNLEMDDWTMLVQEIGIDLLRERRRER